MDILTLLADYHPRDDKQEEVKKEFLKFVLAYPDHLLRSCAPGHLTSSAFIVDDAGSRVLLVHHKKLNKWLQPGGHADGEQDLAAVALREAQEESGLPGLSLQAPVPFDLDRHWIPGRGDVPGHWHYDVRYVVRAGTDERFLVSAESLDLAWRAIDAIAADAQADASLRRMALRWLAATR